MTVPSRAEAARLLLSLDPPAWHVRHSRVVAEVAGWLALRIAERSPRTPIDRRMVEAGALLHDIDKAMSKRSRPDGLGHGAAGGAWLAAHGHPELAPIVTLHPVTRLATDAGVAELETAPIEARVVAYADRRAQQRIVSMAQRFARWDRRHPAGWTPALRAKVWDRAVALEDAVCSLARCEPTAVGRLPWTRAAFEAARGPGAAARP